MKKVIVITTAVMVCVAAFGQGKLGFWDSDFNHLIYFSTDTTKLAPADANTVVNGYPLAGSGLYTGPGSTIAALAGSPTMIAGLWAGTSPSSLSLQATTTIGDSSIEGQMVELHCFFGNNTPTPLPYGVPAWFQVQVYDSRAASAPDAWANLEYGGLSQVFQATPIISFYPSICQATPPVLSTWAEGTFELVDHPGYFGAIEVSVIPEPGTFALVGLGAAVLMIARRRK